MHLNAAARIRASQIYADIELDADLDNSQDESLAGLQKLMQHINFRFGFKHHHLHYRSDDPIKDAHDLVECLNKNGFKMNVKNGILTTDRFAVKGKGGIVLQRLGTSFRIFYSIKR